MSTPLAAARRVVVKIGSSLLTNAGAGLDRNAIADWVRQIAALRARGVEVLVVSSGAIAEGMKRLGWKKPRWLVFNKADLLEAKEAEARAREFVRRLRWTKPWFVVSAITGEGTKDVTYAVMDFLEKK